MNDVVIGESFYVVVVLLLLNCSSTISTHSTPALTGEKREDPPTRTVAGNRADRQSSTEYSLPDTRFNDYGPLKVISELKHLVEWLIAGSYYTTCYLLGY